MATAPSFPFTFALVGAGKVGTAVGRILMQRGNEPRAVASRTTESAQRAATLLTTRAVEIDELPRVDVILIGAGDAAIAEVAGRLDARKSVVVHFAGAYGLEPLRSVIERGAFGCALHPVQACPDVATAMERLPGSRWGVTTTWPARRWAHAFVSEEMQGKPVDVEEDARPIWHAAAVSTSNGIAALMAVGERLLGSIGIADPVDVLGPLALGTVENAIDGGGGAVTLTGPAARGESVVIERHLGALRQQAPHLVEAYALAAEVILEVGNIDEATIASIRRLLEESR